MGKRDFQKDFNEMGGDLRSVYDLIKKHGDKQLLKDSKKLLRRWLPPEVPSLSIQAEPDASEEIPNRSAECVTDESNPHGKNMENNYSKKPILPWENENEKEYWKYMERSFGGCVKSLKSTFKTWLDKSTKEVGSRIDALAKEICELKQLVNEKATTHSQEDSKKEAKLRELETALRSAQADLKQTKADLDDKEVTLQVAQGELEKAKADLSSKEAALQAAQGELEKAKANLSDKEAALRKLEEFAQCVDTYQEIQDYVQAHGDAAVNVLRRNNPFAFMFWCGDKRNMQKLHDSLMESPNIEDGAYQDFAWKALDFCMRMNGKVSRTQYVRMGAQPGDTYNRSKHTKKGTDIPSASSRLQRVIFDGIIEEAGQQTLCPAYVECES